MFKKIIVASAGLFISFASWANDCPAVDQQSLAVEFKTSSNTGLKSKSEQNWRYIRQANKVVFYYPMRNVAEQWMRNEKQQLAFERWFLTPKRVIQYENGDLKSIGQDQQWRAVSQVLNPEILSQLEPQASTRYLCWQQDNYQGEKNGIQIKVAWLPQLNLLRRISWVQGEQQKSITLQQLQSLEQVKSIFTQRETYAEMDFADIGDNEADPFVATMIDQGFGVERDPSMYPEQHGHH